jgi:excisionase family DNA binding protein
LVPEGLGALSVRGVLIYLCLGCSCVSAATQGKALVCPVCTGKDIKQIADGALVFNPPQVKEETKEEFAAPEGNILLTASEVAEHLGISKRVAYELMERKDFPLIRVRRSKRVNKTEFEEWLKSQRNMPKKTY